MMRTLNKVLLLALLSFAITTIYGCRSDDDDNNNNGNKDGTTTDKDGGAGNENSTPPGGTTIFQITSGEIGEGTEVVLNDVIITAVDGYGQYTGDIYVQDPKGGPGSGLKLFGPERIDGGDAVDLKPGDHVKVEGPVKYFTPSTPFDDKKHPNKKHIKELERPKLTHLKSDAPPEPAVVTVAELTEDPTAETWESVLVRVANVAVTAAVNQYGEFEVSGGLDVDDELFPGDPKIGDCLTVTGISAYFYSYKLNPRAGDDIAAGTDCPKPATVTIKDLQDDTSPNHPTDGSQVTVTGIITAIDSSKSGEAGYLNDFFIQDGSGPFSGIAIHYSWTESSALKPVLGDEVEVTGTYKEYYDESQIDKATFISKGTATVPAAEVIANPADIATGGAEAEKYEGVLVEVQNVEVSDIVQTTPSTGEPRTVGVKLKSGLFVEIDLYDFVTPEPPATGTKYKVLRGPLRYTFSNFKIVPRSAEDMQKE